jgi:hypothetical protein
MIAICDLERCKENVVASYGMVLRGNRRKVLRKTGMSVEL